MTVKFDQHFLKNKEVLKTIITNSKIDSLDIVYEIGPGQGMLTKEILNCNPKQLFSIEKDKSMSIFLEEIKSKNEVNFKYKTNKDGVEEIDNYKFTQTHCKHPLFNN